MVIYGKVKVGIHTNGPWKVILLFTISSVFAGFEVECPCFRGLEAGILL